MKIAVIGTGVIGAGLAEGLIGSGHTVLVYNRTAAKAQALVDKGANLCLSAAQAIQDADVAILVLPGAEAVQQVLLTDIGSGALKGKKILNASTTKPEEIESLAKQVSRLGGSLAEVSIMVGGEQLKAKQGEFILGCDSSEETFWTEILSGVATFTVRAGGVGEASRAETPILFSSMFSMVTMAYAAAAALRLNIPQAVLDRYVTPSVPGGAYFLPMMLERNHDTALATANSFSGVAATALSTARSTGLPTGVLEEMQKLFTQAIARGYGAKNGTAICEVLLEPQANTQSHP